MLPAESKSAGAETCVDGATTDTLIPQPCNNAEHEDITPLVGNTPSSVARSRSAFEAASTMSLQVTSQSNASVRNSATHDITAISTLIPKLYPTR